MTEAHKLRDLACFLADGTPADGLRIVKGPQEATPVPAAARPSGSRKLPFAFVGAGVLALGAGVVLYALGEHDDGSKDRQSPGIALISAGALATVVGAWGAHGTAPRRLPYALVGVGAATVAAGVALLLVDEDASPDQNLHITDTGPLGFGLMITGGAAIGLGAILASSHGRADGVPVVSVGTSRTLVGWALQF